MNRPLGITIIAVVLSISGILNVVGGLVGMGILSIDLGEQASGAEAAGLGAVIGGIVTLVVAYGLFATAGWAWLLTVVVMGVRIVLDLWVIVATGLGSALAWAAVVNIIVSGIILWYFFRPNVRAAFGR